MVQQSDFEANYEKVLLSTEELLKISDNRYRLTLQVAFKANQLCYENLIANKEKESIIKPIVQSILDMEEM